jgi:mRNA interferase HicA
MKRGELEKRLKALGWRFSKHGGNHDHWTNGTDYEAVPRHPKINENLAKKILKTAKNSPGKEK